MAEGKLTPQQQEEIIKGGGSVLIQGRIVSRIQDLPHHTTSIPTPAATSQGNGSTPLPEDFPHREALQAAGLTTIEQVRAVEDLTKIDGIGKKNADEIRKALA